MVYTTATSIATFTATNGNKQPPHAQDTSPAANAGGSLHSLVAGSGAAHYQDELMDAITAIPANVLNIRNILSTITVREDLRKPVLFSPSTSTRHKLRTPLMAAASTSEMPIIGKRGFERNMRRFTSSMLGRVLS